MKQIYIIKRTLKLVKGCRKEREIDKMAVSKWTKEMDDYLREHYKYGYIKECAEHFNTTESSVRKRACKLGIKSGRFWRKDQIELLEKNAHKSNQSLEKLFGTNNIHIRHFRYDYGIGGIIESNPDKLCMAEVARLTGKDKSTISKCWCKAGLKYKYVGKRYKMVTIKNLFEFMKEHPEKWNALDCETWFFEKQPWFEEKRKAEALKMRQDRWGKFYAVG